MLGRLFSNSTGIPSASPLKSDLDPVEPSDNSSIAISVLDEADTRSLIYGATSSSSCLNTDPAKHIRVVIVSDVYSSDLAYDSAASTTSTSTTGPCPPLSSSISSSSLQSSTCWRPSLDRRLSAEPKISRGPSSARHARGQNGSHRSSSPLPGENISIQLLKEIVFGTTPLRFNEYITKIHLVPGDEKASKRTWLVTRLFKFGPKCPQQVSSIISNEKEQEFSSLFSFNEPNHNTHDTHSNNVLQSRSSSPPNSSNQNSTSPHSSPLGSNPLDSFSSNESPSCATLGWNPCSATTFPCHKATPENRCGIGLFISLPTNSNILTTHWEELSFALTHLQSVVLKRLSATICQRLTSLDGDESIRHAVDFFRNRLIGAFKIPRVICGQDRWSDLLTQLRWASATFDSSNFDSSENFSFLAMILASFITSNKILLDSSHLAPLQNPSTRTVIVCNNRISARRMIFILTSLIHDASSRQYLRSAPLIYQGPNSDGDPEMDGDNNNTLHNTPHKSPSALISTEGGWQIPSAKTQAVESPSLCTLSHVIRPSFSSQSLSQSLHGQRARFPSVDNLRKSLTPSLASSSSFLSALWSSSPRSDKEEAQTPGTSFDDYLYNTSSAIDDRPLTDFDHLSELSTSVTSSGGHFSRPHLNRFNSGDRTATPSSVSSHGLYTYSDTDLAMSGLSLMDSAIEYNTVEVPDSSNSVLQVSPLSVNDLNSQEPVTLPPVAGHGFDFHPDFCIQACGQVRELEDKIARTMIRDADLISIDETCQAPTLLSRTLMINLNKREICEWILVRTSAHGQFQQQLLRKKLFCNRKPLPNCVQLANKVNDVLHKVLYRGQDDDPESTLEMLKEAYESRFSL